MTKSGFVISKSRARAAFFSASSSYDNPKWMSVNEATVYQTETSADKALSSLYKHGAYEAFCMPISEAFGREDEVLPVDNEPADEVMQSQDTQEVCPQCDHEPCSCEDGEDDDLDINVDQEVDDAAVKLSRQDEEVSVSAKRFVTGQPVMYKDKSYVVSDDSGNGVVILTPVAGSDDTRPIRAQASHVTADSLSVRESADIPVRSTPDNAKSSDNGKTALDMPKPETIKYDDISDEFNLSDTGVMAGHEDSIKVPSNVLTDLRAKITELQKQLDNSSDDAQSSFLMTTIDAFEELHKQISLKTGAGIKQAQIYLMTLMNAITMHLPASTSKFITNGGRSPSLADRFADAWQAKK